MMREVQSCVQFTRARQYGLAPGSPESPALGGESRRLQLATGTAVWYGKGQTARGHPAGVVRDPKKRFEPQALLSTDLKLSAREIVTYFIRRWSMETTFQEARLYLGLAGQRQ
jgi:hypothetical protein